MSNTQVQALPFLYANNLQISNNATTPDSKLDVTAGQARNTNNTMDIVLPTAVVVDAETNGANGLDTGALANSTWYAVHLIGSSLNLKPAAAMLSTSATAPLMPLGYDLFWRIGWTKTDGSADLLPYNVYGNGNVRKYVWDAVVTELSAAGNTSFTDVDLATSVAPTSTLAYLNWKLVPATAGNICNLRVNGSSSTTNLEITGSVAAVANAGQVTINTDSAQIIEYKTAHADDDLTLTEIGRAHV